MVESTTVQPESLLERITPDDMIGFAKQIFPINRSLTGDGVRQTLALIQQHLPELKIHEVPSGSQCFDWTVPPEWKVRQAYILTPDGRRICDFEVCNLHLVGYSISVDRKVDLQELQEHLYSLPDQPDAIPYITSYYSKRWGFCISENERETLQPGEYHVVIDSEHNESGSLSYGELVLPGNSDREIFYSTYICHPQMANNEVSGPTVAMFLAKWAQHRKDRKHTYRFVFIPETIGSIVYLSRNLDHLKSNVEAGFNVTCVGDERAYSHLPSRAENTVADRIARHVLQHTDPNFVQYSFLDRGSDERQYCSPGVDLPVTTVMRSKYGTYPEYHTSLDNFDVVTGKGLFDSLTVLRRCSEALERNHSYRITVRCEPQLGKRGLYPEVSTRDTKALVGNMMNFLAYADGTRDLLAIAEKIECPIWELYEWIEKFLENGLIERVSG